MAFTTFEHAAQKISKKWDEEDRTDVNLLRLALSITSDKEVKEWINGNDTYNRKRAG